MLLKSFHGGVHPPQEKSFTKELPFEKMKVPSQVIIPLLQHLGKQAKPLVKKGSIVSEGSKLAEASGFISAPVHSSVNGTVTGISRETAPGGFPSDSVIIKTDERTDKINLVPLDPCRVSAEEIVERVKNAGIVGMGGASFPTYVKLKPPAGTVISAVILNGCECEPYLTRDYRFMLERTNDLIAGLKLIMKALGVEQGYIGIENNKPDAANLIQQRLENEKSLSVIVLKTKYPQGAEKMLIKAVTGEEVPPGRLPPDVGIVIQNTATAIAIYDAVVNGEVQVTAAVTVTGRGVISPKNLIIPIGTSIKDVLDYCGGLTGDAAKVIAGGPMMGTAQYDLSAPVVKAISGIVVLTKKDIDAKEETACLRCGRCISVCPLNLMPTRLARYTQLGNYELAEASGITVCMECGSCAYTCPANIPLVQWLRLGKQKALQIQSESLLQKV